MTAAAPTPGYPPDAVLRDQLSNLRGLLLFAVLMTECDDEGQITHLATSSIPSLGTARLRALYIEGSGWQALDGPRAEPALSQLEAQLHSLDGVGGPVRIPGDAWAWAFALGGRTGSFLVVGAAVEPSTENRFLLQVLAQETGVALANARLHAQERATAKRLEETLGALQRSMDIHKRLTQVAVRCEGQEGLAQAIHELTGYPVAIEDRYGNLRAWAGPDRTEPYPKDPAPKREQLLRRLIREARPSRDGNRLVALARPRGDLLGVIALVDPGGDCGEHERVALEHGATILAMELARLRSLSEAELRLRRDLVESLLDGTDDETVQSRAQGLGYDLGRSHRVVIAEGRGRTRDDDVFFQAVRRASLDLSVGTLMVARKGAVLVLASQEVPWEEFRQAVLRELGGGRCRLGVGGLCERPADFARSHREAELTLRMEDACSRADRASSFDDLGVYRLFCELPDLGAVERFVRERLGGLLDYDRRKHSDLVRTLTLFLEHGGNYIATAEALFVHPSTLKYRLQRIRDLTGYDLNNPDTRFSLQLSTRAWQMVRARREEEVPPPAPGAGRRAPTC
ncbi:MAG: transcriptional regulator, CdaR family [Chloroflexi bacterium]|jgi:sugar diacid utilization regulator|nr:transcriptional regulator, CdaR family [Chloroflexota bacterium]